MMSGRVTRADPGAALALALGVLALAGAPCTGEQPGAGQRQGTTERRGAFRGTYINAFETSVFIECGAPDGWWTDLGPGHPAVDGALLTATGAERRVELYLAVRGRLSAPGKYGHMGVYDRELTVDSVEAVRVWAPALCK